MSVLTEVVKALLTHVSEEVMTVVEPKIEAAIAPLTDRVAALESAIKNLPTAESIVQEIKDAIAPSDVVPPVAEAEPVPAPIPTLPATETVQAPSVGQ